MRDLFEREEQTRQRAQAFLDSLGDEAPAAYREEFAYLTTEYSGILRQLRWVTRISDLTALGLNCDKTALLNKVNVDALTEIYNRRYLTSNFEYYLEVMEHSGECLTVMMVDIDNFKHYNDLYGHSAGDTCLRKIASTMHEALLGPDDFVVRYGGEEFVVVLPGAGRDSGLQTAGRMLEEIRRLQIPHRDNAEADCVTVSIGVTSAVPAHGSKMQLFIDKADQALYLSKRSGKNKCTFLAYQKEGDSI